jgi:prophage antirepressor-like protein
MSDLISFSFESANVRILKDEKGEPLFVGKDLCDVLGYADHTNAMKQHCRGVVKRHPIVDAIGRTQEVRVLTEPDMLRLIVNSKLPAAQKFEAWVFEEVLPTLRKTGEYNIPKKREPSQATIASQASALFPKLKAVAECIGITGNAAAISANQAVMKVTGVNLLSLLEQTHLPADPRGQTYTATAIAKRVGATGPSTINWLLEEKGLHTKVDRGWMPTEHGLQFGEWYDTSKRHSNGTPIKQWKWFDEVINEITPLDVSGMRLQIAPVPV